MKFILLSFGAFIFSVPVAAQQQPDIPTLASALDRCMATYAVRMSGGDATDDAIYAAASNGCQSIETELLTLVRSTMPAERAEPALQQWAAQKRPNFMAVLQRIRADRAVREH